MISEAMLSIILKMLIYNRMVERVDCAIGSDHEDYKLNDYGCETVKKILRELRIGAKHRALMATPLIVIKKK